MAMLEFIFVGLGGFIGACLRFALTKLTNQFSLNFPYGTLLSNVIAGLLIGFVIGAEQQSVTLNPKTRVFLTTGLLGGLSTFSTFGLETVTLFQDGKYLLATGNIALNLVLSLCAVVLGMVCAKAIFKKA
jgi:CrcB protein